MACCMKDAYSAGFIIFTNCALMPSDGEIRRFKQENHTLHDPTERSTNPRRVNVKTRTTTKEHSSDSSLP